MGHASVFVNLVVPPNGCIRGCLDDLRNFYRAFEVSTERAAATAVGPFFRARDFQGCAALSEFVKRRPDLTTTPATRVACCFSGLSKGDRIAQVSRGGVLKALEPCPPRSIFESLVWSMY